MGTTIITPEDLKEFKAELLEEIRKILDTPAAKPSQKWLRSAEVLEMLKMSMSSLNNLRANGSLPFTKIGGIIYYEADDVEKLFTNNSSSNE